MRPLPNKIDFNLMEIQQKESKNALKIIKFITIKNYSLLLCIFLLFGGWFRENSINSELHHNRIKIEGKICGKSASSLIRTRFIGDYFAFFRQ